MSYQSQLPDTPCYAVFRNGNAFTGPAKKDLKAFDSTPTYSVVSSAASVEVEE